jgi:fermentation-respiration switch protein FrsA (DUF1100 family)
MRLARRVLLLTALVAILVYAGAIVWLVARETTLVFQPGVPLGERRPATPFTSVDIHQAEGPHQLAWIVPAATGSPAAPWVLFLHGQGSNLASRMNIVHYEQLARLGLNVLAPEYRGFGGVPGVPSESGLGEDARSAYEYLRRDLHADRRQIVIYGWSLGSAVAVTLASQVDEAAVVLEGAPSSVLAIGEQRYPFVPIRLLIRNPFDSIDRIGRIGSPVLFLHSPEDSTIPIAEGRRLFGAAAEPKTFVEVAGGHVYASERDPRFFPAIRAFLQAQRLLP